MIFLLSIFFFLSGSIYGMDQLVQNLEDLHTSLSNLESNLQNLEVRIRPIRPVREWSINLNQLPGIIDELVATISKEMYLKFGRSKIINDFKTINDAPQFLSTLIGKEIKNHSQKITKWLSPSTDQTQTALKNQLENILYEYFTTEWTTPLSWCTCVLDGNRIALIIDLIEQIKVTHPNRNQPLVYTSLGSGGLLQDYLTIKELLNAGYKNINVNLIDLIYPDVPLTPKEGLLNVTQQIHETFLKQIKDVPKIKLFKEKIDKLAQKSNSKITITTYNRTEWYKYKASKYNGKKSDILLMVDPGLTIEDYTMPSYPSEASVFGIKIGSDIDPESPEIKQLPSFFLFMPRQGPAQLYSRKPKDQRLAKEFDETLKAITNFINQASAKEGYKPQLIEKIIENTKFRDRIFYIADPHIAFQDLVLHTLSNNPVVYTLQHPNPTIRESRIKRIDIDAYKNADVVTPNSGAHFISKGYEKVNI